MGIELEFGSPIVRCGADVARGVRIRRAELERRLADVELASGLSLRHINRIERSYVAGDRINPNLDTLLALSRGLGKPIIIDGRSFERQPLTENQDAVWRGVCWFLEEQHRTPSITDLCAHCGISSSGSVHKAMLALIDKEYIQRDQRGKLWVLIYPGSGSDSDG